MNNENFLKVYRTNKNVVWVKCKLSNGKEHYYANPTGWLRIKEICEGDCLFVEELELQFRSHLVIIDVKDAEAVYLIRSVMGQMGGDSHDYYTTGVLKDGVMHKKMWLIPELIIEKELEDDLDECFEEAIIYNEKKKKNRKE